MKIKFLRAYTAALFCLIVFLATTFIPWMRDSKWGDFLQGFSAGAGVGALIAAIHYYNLDKKERQAAGQI